ncbi:MAG: TusE/DsrC/DsvC family sulfur relay protein [Granulosicoccus sp.]|nr:TusE/DsrC/DsvC family sulfur relay protein [Granulosicoccus sp.]
MQYWLTIDALDLRLEVDNEGFLLDPADWSPELAVELARLEEIALGDQHWAVVNFVRDEFETNEVVPAARHVLRMLKAQFGEAHASRKALYQLFPYGYGQQACKIAGMRKPLKLMLDV